MDNKKCDMHERRKSFLVQELQRHTIDIAALDDTCLVDTGKITEEGTGHTRFCSGKVVDEIREAGVGFAILTTRVRKLAPQRCK